MHFKGEVLVPLNVELLGATGLLSLIGLAPVALMMVTSFVRMSVVLSLLRSALGLQQSPPNAVLVGLAVFLTGFVMTPVLEKSYEDGVRPYIAGALKEPEAFARAAEPFRTFMLKHTRDKDLSLFLELGNRPKPETPQDVAFNVLVPSFMIGELRRAFEIGFLLYTPFLIIDLVVSSILMALGMMMLPPVMIALPFKLLFFVLIDGWHLLAETLVKGYGG